MQKFDSREQLDDYIVDQSYAKEDGLTGICFGFTVKEFSDNDYELELIFNDLWPSKMKSLPY